MNEALTYIRTSLATGKDIQTIRNEFSQNGWTSEQIEKLIKETENPPRNNKKIFILLMCAAILVVLISVTAYSYAVLSKKPIPKTTQSLPLSIPESSNITETYYSPDKKSFAVVVKKIDGYYQLFINGEMSSPYELVMNGVFSPDGKRFVYLAKQGNDIFLVEDGQKKEKSSFAEIQDEPYPQAITFSPDSKHLAYIVKSENGESVVMDGKTQQSYPRIYPINPSTKRLFFSPDSKKLAYVVDNHKTTFDRDKQEEDRKTQEQKLIINEKEVSEGFNSIFEFVFSPNSEHFAFVGLKDARATAYLDGKDLYIAQYAIQDLNSGDIPSNLTFTTTTNELVFGGRKDGTQNGFIQVGQKNIPIPFPISRNGIRKIIAGHNSQDIAYVANRDGGLGNLGSTVIVVKNQIKELPSVITNSSSSITTSILSFIVSSDMKNYAGIVSWEGYGEKLVTIFHNQTPVKTYFLTDSYLNGSPSSVNFAANLELTSDGFTMLYAVGRKTTENTYDVSINNNGFESILTQMAISTNIFASTSEDVIFSLTNDTVNYIAQHGSSFTPKSIPVKDMIFHSNSYSQKVTMAIKTFSEVTDVAHNEEPLLYSNQNYTSGYGGDNSSLNTSFSLKNTPYGSTTLLYPINKTAYIRTSDGKITKEILQ